MSRARGAPGPDLDLGAPCRFVPGIGPARATALDAAGIRTVEDLLQYLPFRYEDRSRFARIAELRAGEPRTIRAEVGEARIRGTRRRGFLILEAPLRDATGQITAIWYNQPFLRNVLRPGRVAAFFGEPRAARGARAGLVLENPRFEILTEEGPESIHTGRVVPVYQRIDPMSPRQIRQAVHAALARLPARLPDPLPPGVRTRLGLLDRREAFERVHFPGAAEIEAGNRGTSPAHRRLLFEDLFLLQAGLAAQRRARLRIRRERPNLTTPEIGRRLRSLLPFALTSAQRRAFREIVADLRRPYPMHRLLQGEVGSGKTIVALLAMLVVVESGGQAALMAPTGILAEQHHLTFRNLLRGRGYRLDRLQGGMPERERERIRTQIASGEIQILVGTHSLIQEGVRFRRLGIVVIDEQHRFGVEQRARLQAGRERPDVLVMTATPIPRTLTLTVYGDLDLSVIDELPPGRRPVRTFLRDGSAREAIHRFVRDRVRAGGQAFIVSPRLEEAPGSLSKAARPLARELAEGPFRGLPMQLIHGRMPAEAKERLMAEFAAGRIGVLVATTLVEVGVDAPGATVMVVENAERFGLSQLHQLRGRVGRGARGGVCILVAGEEAGEEARRRLQILAACNDGFRLAEADLEFRGPGEMLGVRQSGLPDPWWARLLRNRDLIEPARAEALAAEAEPGGGAEAETLLRFVEDRWRRRFARIQVG